MPPGKTFAVNGDPVFRIDWPEKKSRKWRLTATFKDLGGREVCKIKNNELQILTSNWDVVQTANRFSVLNNFNELIFEMECIPPRCIRINHLKISPGGGLFHVEGDELKIHSIAGQGGATFKRCTLQNLGNVNIGGSKISIGW